MDRGTWIEPGLLACSFPKRESALAALTAQGITRLINLRETPLDPARPARHGLTEVHIPVRDFTAPTAEQIDRGLAAIKESIAAGQKVAVHCTGGLGRKGTLVACYLVDQGLAAGAAIERLRAVRPGSVETKEQVAAIQAYASRRNSPDSSLPG